MKNEFAWNPKNKVLYDMMASCPGVIVINWLFQGMLGMDKSELIFHLLFDLTFTVTFSLVLSLIFPQGLAIILGILMAHSLNWLINTHFWAIARECGITHNHPSRLLKYIKFLGDVANGQPFLLGIAVFGSIARSGTVRSDLDIDMRYVREKGFINGLKANLFSIREKMRAFFSKMPLDSYVCDDVKSLDKLRRNERPIIVYDPKEILKEKYQERGYDLLEDIKPIEMHHRRIKMCIVCSAGGHLLEATLATKTLPYERYYVTFYAPHLQHLLNSDNYYFVTDPYRNVLKFLINFFQSLRIHLREKPNVIITTGACIAIATCLIAKIFGAKVIIIETAAAIRGPSGTGKFLYPFADLFFVQWKSQLRHYKSAVYVGDLF